MLFFAAQIKNIIFFNVIKLIGKFKSQKGNPSLNSSKSKRGTYR